MAGRLAVMAPETQVGTCQRDDRSENKASARLLPPSYPFHSICQHPVSLLNMDICAPHRPPPQKAASKGGKGKSKTTIAPAGLKAHSFNYLLPFSRPLENAKHLTEAQKSEPTPSYSDLDFLNVENLYNRFLSMYLREIYYTILFKVRRSTITSWSVTETPEVGWGTHRTFTENMVANQMLFIFPVLFKLGDFYK